MADTKISALTAVVTPDGADEFAVNQATVSKKMTLTQVRSSLPTVPTIISVGTEFTSTGVPTATLPGTHAANDILLLIIESANDADVAAPAGYARLGPQNAIGAASTAGTVKLSIFWKRDNGAESVPTLVDTGNHTYGVMIAVRGCRTVGDPFALGGQNFKFTASTTGTSVKGACNADNVLVMAVFGHAINTGAATASAPTNADLTSVTEQFDDGTVDGIGGGICVITGIKANAGSYGPFTVTWGASTVDVSTIIKWIPVDVFGTSRLTEVQTFIASPADLDDVWVKPDGAKSVRVQMIDGGGSGSSGHTITTAEGGGGGGGGGYSERLLAAEDLAATVTVHAGKGGAATTAAVDQVGNIGVISQFGKGLTPPYLAANVAGIVAGAAASAVGGAGGSGSGAGTVSPAAGARIGLEAATAGRADGFTGGRGGGPGGAAPIAGSPAVYGGGGGESGGDTDAASAASGFSMYGAGGGGGGRTVQATGTAGPAGGGAAAKTYAVGAAGNNSTILPYGGSGGCGGDSTTAAGGAGGFPGGGGGGGGGNNAATQGGRGGHGCVVVTTFF